ncbi:hypothetical protein ACVWZR_001353 [Bradyrhizobium sp. i1.3.1]
MSTIEIAVADHIAAAFEVTVQDLVVAIGLVLVAVVRVVVVLVLGRKMLEVHGLARIRPDAGGNEHQP